MKPFFVKRLPGEWFRLISGVNRFLMLEFDDTVEDVECQVAGEEKTRVIPKSRVIITPRSRSSRTR